MLGGPTEFTHDVVQELLRRVGRELRLVLANACFSLELAEALVGDGAGSIDVAIGTKARLYDEDAIVYASSLLSMIADGFSVGTAHGVALLLLRANNPDIGRDNPDEIPRLFVRDGVRADEYVLVERRSGARRPDGARADTKSPRASLRELWSQLSLPPLRLLMVVQVGRTLSKTRVTGKIREDVRPDNVLIADGRARLGDLEAGRVVPGTQRDPYRYSPSTQHQNALDVAVRSEIHALAMLAVFALTGSDPDVEAFQRDRYALLERLDCPRSLRLHLARALAAPPHDSYYRDVDELCYDLHECVEDREIWERYGARDDALAMLLKLERMSPEAFGALVRSAETDAWRCREGTQAQRAADLLDRARRTQDEGLLSKIREQAVPREPPGPAAEPDTPVQTGEDAFVALCSFPREWFEGFLLGYENVITTRGDASQLSGAAALVEACARPAAESRLLADIHGIVRRFKQRLTPPDPTTPYVRLSWIHERMRVALERLVRVSEIDPAEFDRLVSTRNYDQLDRELLKIPHKPDFPLSLLPLVDQAEALVRAAIDVCARSRLTLAADVEPRFSLYRTLCRLDAAAWKGVWARFMLPCMLVVNANRATVVRSLIEHTAPWCLQALRDAVRSFVGPAAVSTDAPDEDEVIDVETEIEALPEDLLAELSLRMNLHIAPSRTREPGYDLRFVILAGPPERSGQGQTAYPGELQAQLSRLCSEVRGPWRGKTTTEALDEAARGTLDEQLRRYGVSELRRIWSSLRLPEWFQPPAESLHRDAVALLTDFSAWLRLPWWQSAVAEAAGRAELLLARIDRERG
ncbi:hypothetical protein OV079_02755 [Nannocystis pusilla]|uniref:CHAT domain-containing protein n=1 Tax=Nannocystis pusilla TaxID=889268 RepID=A0A9X3EIU1_9BACT|nr:hypothetical protein [Nannocystis pusilla]MCY1004505.1 hypothetical protein [Nannocystis pusilla]